MLRDVRLITGSADPLRAEAWASDWLGPAWLNAPIGDREAEHSLCREACGRACARPSPHGLAAVAALARVAPAAAAKTLAEAVEVLTETQPPPSWHVAASPGWAATAAWRAVDVWESERVLFIDYDGPHPHTLMARILLTGGLLVDKLALLEPGAVSQWDGLHGEDDVPMPIAEQPVADVLADLASVLRVTDMTWPRNEDEDYVSYRALAWSRCRDHLSDDWPDMVPFPENERRRLIEEFVASHGRDDPTLQSLAELFLDYGEGYIRSGPLCWSPVEVELFLTDWLPRKATLDADQRQALPSALRQWLTFALTQRGIATQWITPVVEEVDTHLQEFRDAFDDQAAWGPGKQIAVALAERGVDLTDEQAVQDAIRALNAEGLARRLTGETQEF